MLFYTSPMFVQSFVSFVFCVLYPKNIPCYSSNMIFLSCLIEIIPIEVDSIVRSLKVTTIRRKITPHCDLRFATNEATLFTIFHFLMIIFPGQREIKDCRIQLNAAV